MTRFSTIVAAASLAIAAFAATAPAAEAGYHLIRWQGNGFCQIWNDNVLNLLDRSVYVVASTSVPTLVEAMADKEVMLRRGSCAF